MLYHFWMRSFSGRVPVCAATSFFRSPMVSSSLHLTRIFLPWRDGRGRGIRYGGAAERRIFGEGGGEAGRGTAVGGRRRETHQTVVEDNLDHGE